MTKNRVHLDFHNSGLIHDIGSKFEPNEFSETLVNAKVESITCFAKCHHGYLYYETNLDERHPHLSKNILNEQIKSAHQHGIEVPIYISVGFDELQALQHPEWIAIDEDGKRIKEFGTNPFDSGWNWLCLNNGYQNKIVEVIEDVRESVDAVDGFFFDIVTQPKCCCHRCISGMLSQDLNPELLEDRALYAQIVEKKFKERIKEVIIEKNPEASIFFNGVVWNEHGNQYFSGQTQLEIEALASGIWGYDYYDFVNEYLRRSPYPRTAMTARFHKSWADFGGYKNPAALEYEVIRGFVGSGHVSVGDQMHPLGMLDQKAYHLMGDTFEKAESYRNFNLDNRMCDVAIVIDNTSDTHLFSDSVKGAKKILEENQIMHTIIDVNESFSNYKLLLIPDNLNLNEIQVSHLSEYLDNGGTVIYSYMSLINTDSFNWSPIQTRTVSPFTQDYLLVDDAMNIMYQSGMNVVAKQLSQQKYEVFNPYFNRTYKSFSSHFQTPYSETTVFKGVVSNDRSIYFAHPIFSLYWNEGNTIYSDLVMIEIKNIMDSRVEMSAPRSVRLEVFENKDDFDIVLMNYIPVKRGSIYTIDNGLAFNDVFLAIDGVSIDIPHNAVGNIHIKHQK